MELRTEHLALVPLSVKPEEVVEHLGVIVPAGWPAPDLRDILPRYLSELDADPSLLGFGPWLLLSDGEVVGDAGFLGRPDSRRTVELGYSVLPEQRRHGFATEAAMALSAWALAQPNVERVIAACAPPNTPSIRVLEKVGFARIGERAGELLWELRPST
jgi:[ribosomal protein S5]-alanine N-acetyltransferase